MKMKYVITETMGLETPFIFPEWVNHNDAVQGFIGKPISAEFVFFIGTEENAETCLVSNKIEVKVSGESTTLKLKSRPEDAKIIERIIMRCLD